MRNCVAGISCWEWDNLAREVGLGGLAVLFCSALFSLPLGVTPWKIHILNPKMEVWKMIFLFNWVIFRFHLNFQGSTHQLLRYKLPPPRIFQWQMTVLLGSPLAYKCNKNPGKVTNAIILGKVTSNPPPYPWWGWLIPMYVYFGLSPLPVSAIFFSFTIWFTILTIIVWYVHICRHTAWRKTYCTKRDSGKRWLLLGGGDNPMYTIYTAYIQRYPFPKVFR